MHLFDNRVIIKICWFYSYCKLFTFILYIYVANINDNATCNIVVLSVAGLMVSYKI